MHFTSLVSIAILAFAHSTHSALVTDGRHTHSPETFTSSSLCGTTTWNLHTKDKRPLASDCKKLEQRLRKQKKKGSELYGWKPEDRPDEYLILEAEGTCNFGANVINTNNAPSPIANGDIADILRDAVEYYAIDGHVYGITGIVPCQANWGAFSTQQIGWNIFTF